MKEKATGGYQWKKPELVSWQDVEEIEDGELQTCMVSTEQPN